MVLDTILEIDETLAKINSHEEFSATAKHKYLESIRIESAKHSLGIEGIKCKELQKKNRKKTPCSNLQEARRFLKKEGITLHTLSILGHVISPEANPYKNFRNTSVMFGEFEPPSSIELIIHRIHNMITTIDDTRIHPIIRGIEAHISMVQTHPYYDGNGRGARLVQNQILEENGYTAALIPSSEREIYIELMKVAMRDRFSKKSRCLDPSDSELILHKFLACKILSTTQSLRESLYQKRQYSLVLKNVSNPNIAYTTAQMIRRYGNVHNKGIKINIEKLNSGRKAVKLKITGDISFDEITQRMKKYGSKPGFSNYTLKKITK